MANYQEKMLTELNKFLSVYNTLSGNTIQIGDDNYPEFIRILGNYLYTTNIDSWTSTSISFGNVTIDMSVFANTTYQTNVQNFLILLKKAFHSNLDEEIINYISTTSDFTEDEKKTCSEFHVCMSRLQASMKQGIFKDAIAYNVASNEAISSYSKQLKEFNDYTKMIAADPLKYNIVNRFKEILPVIASQKRQPDIFFDA